jgi:DNA-binding response OmpR family regulator
VAAILCIDDHTRGFVSRIDFLQSHGHTVLVAANQSTAIDLLARNTIDAMILDCRLDGINGLVSALRIVRPNLPVVMLSGYCGVPCKLAQEADACIQKGETGATLLKALENVIRSARYGLCRAIPIRPAA